MAPVGLVIRRWNRSTPTQTNRAPRYEMTRFQHAYRNVPWQLRPGLHKARFGTTCFPRGQWNAHIHSPIPANRFVRIKVFPGNHLNLNFAPFDIFIKASDSSDDLKALLRASLGVSIVCSDVKAVLPISKKIIPLSDIVIKQIVAECGSLLVGIKILRLHGGGSNHHHKRSPPRDAPRRSSRKPRFNAKYKEYKASLSQTSHSNPSQNVNRSEEKVKKHKKRGRKRK